MLLAPWFCISCGSRGVTYIMGKSPLGIEDDMIIGELNDIAIIPGSFCGYPGWIRVCYSNLNLEDCVIAADFFGKGPCLYL